MSECTHDCSSCGENCGSRTEPQSFIEPLNASSSVGKVIGIVSGKGGVGKSLITGMLATLFSRKGYKTAVMDADITGPSIPKMFGAGGRLKGSSEGIIPAESRNRIKLMSVNLMLENPMDPVVWRGPVIAGVVKQFWTDVIWGDVDYMFVDMPPGTGDVPLTVYQSIKLDGIVIVTSPQELVSMIVEKAVKMAKKMNIKIYGVVENMSYIKCPDCGREIDVFGSSKVDEVATDFDLKVLGRLPIDREIAAAVDAGKVESLADKDYLALAVKEICK